MDDTSQAKLTAALRTIIPDGPQRTHVQARPGHVEYSGSPLSYEAYYGTRDIEGTPVREGDFLIKARLSGGKFINDGRTAIHGTFERVPRGCFPVIAEHADSALRFLEGTYGRDVADLATYLTHRMALRGSDATSQILIVRPFSAPGERTDPGQHRRRGDLRVDYRDGRADAGGGGRFRMGAYVVAWVGGLLSPYAENGTVPCDSTDSYFGAIRAGGQLEGPV